VLPVSAVMGPRLTLGYRRAVALQDSILAPAGARVTGHEFHRTQVQISAGAAAWGWQDNAKLAATEGLVSGRIHASYLHVHWAGHPQVAARFVTSARESGR
ncbi:MAG: cobyrinate a,c-diamide synthase, partial [Mycobacteriaceae bacterium]